MMHYFKFFFMRIYNNFDLVQINLGSDNKYYLPESVDFAGKKINNIMILTARSGQTTGSPFDQRTLVDESELQNFYVELYNSDGVKIKQNLSALNLDIRTNAKYEIDSILSLKLSNINYVGSTTFVDKCILMYVSYLEKKSDDIELSNRQLNITITTSDDVVKLSDYVDEYLRRIDAKVKAIECFYNPGVAFYLDLRVENDKVFRMIPGDLLFSNGIGLGIKNQPCFVNDLDIDFKNSYLYKAVAGSITVNISLYY